MDKELNKILKETGNRIPFSVPENYFNNFAAEMDAKIATEKISVIKLIKPWLYMAAMFVGVFILGNVFYDFYQNNKKIDDDLYELYVMSQIDQTVELDFYQNESNGIE